MTDNNSTEDGASGLMDPLESRGFRPVETALPGDWGTNGALSIQITSERRIDRRRVTVARVYDARADALAIPRAELLAISQSDDNVTAATLALEAAEGGVADSEVSE